MANLTGQNIKDTYQQLVTLGSGTTITNGTGSQITHLAVTASQASHAVTASYALNAGVTVDTGSLMVTGSVSGNVLTFTKGDGSAFNLTVDTGSATAVNTGSLMVTASAAGNVITFTKGDASTFAITVNTGSAAVTASYALNAERLGAQLPSHYATAGSVTSLSSSLSTRLTTDESQITSLTAATSSYALKTQVSGAFASTSASFSTRLTTDESNISANTAAITSLTAATSSYALKTEVSGAFASVSSSFATRLTTDEAIITSLVAATGSYAKINTNNNFTGLQTFNNIAVNGTASIGYLEAVTGSAKIIGDAYIILNNDTPAQRYAGIKVIDSGSANTTASLLFDGSTNDWFYEYEGGDTTNFGVVLFGPEYGTIGSPLYPTANQIQKGTGGHHLTGSNITDDGSVVSIASRVNVTGAVTASLGFKGALDGNAATATSASFATTASYALNADLRASQESGTILLRNIAGEIYGSAVAPTSGNITVTTGGKTPGAVAVIYHQDTVEPNLLNVTVDKKVGNYAVSALNVITLTYISGSNILEYIAGADISFALSSSYAAYAVNATSASHAVNANIALDADQVLVVEKSDNVNYQLVFRQDATNQYSDIFADSANALTFNPSTGVLAVPTTTTTASFATTASRAISANIADTTSNANVDFAAGAIGRVMGAYGTTTEVPLDIVGNTSVYFNTSNGDFYAPNFIGTGSYALLALTASHATSAGSATTATSASFASTASLATLSFNNNSASGSIGFWQGTQAEYNSISGSASNSIIYFIV